MDKVFIDAGQRNQYLWLEDGGFPSDLLSREAEYRSMEQRIHLPKELAEMLLRDAEHSNQRLYSVLLTAVYIMLYKYKGDDRLTIGIPSQRFGSHMDGTWIPLQIRVDEQNMLQSLLKQLDGALNEFENSNKGHILEQETMDSARTSSFNSGQAVAVTLENSYGKPSADGVGLLFSYSVLESESPAITLTMTYNSSAYSTTMMKNLANHVHRAAELLVRGDDILLRDAAILDEDEVQALIKSLCVGSCSSTEAKPLHRKGIAGESSMTLHHLFEKQAQSRPYETALICGEESFTYDTLNQRAHELASRLRSEGVRSGIVVGLMVERTVELVVGIIGIWKAGGAYLPIDLEYPEDRIHYMLEDTKAPVLLTQHDYLSKASQYEGNIVCIDERDEQCAAGGEEKDSHILSSSMEQDNSSQNLAYVIYTSGSTGRPKGVMIQHESAIRFIEGMAEQVEYVPGKTIVALASAAFDVSIHDLIMPLLYGMKVILASQAERRDPELLDRLIVKHDVEIMVTTPMRLQMLLAGKEERSCLRYLKDLIIGGEPFIPTLWNRLKPYPQLRIYNVYGPTETTVWSTIQRIEDNHPGIGKPLAGVRTYILDKVGRLQPPGVAGELCIAGTRLAQGYLGKPELTEEQFVSDPFYPGERMYRTGDLARFLNDGNLEFLGRSDFQVKIRGHRVELEEVGMMLARHEDVTESAVLLEDEQSNGGLLCAYYAAESELSTSELRSFMASRVPEYMVPQRYIWLAALPLNNNGKIDRKALPKQSEVARLQDNAAFALQLLELDTNTERKVAALWQEVLHTVDFAAEDNFFEVGGNSILLVALHHNLEQHYHSRVSVADLFGHATLRGMAALMDAPFSEEGDMEGLAGLKGLTFPNRMISRETGIDHAAIPRSCKLDEALLGKLMQLSEDIGSDIVDILLVLYMYVLSDITMSDEVTVIVKDGVGDRMVPVSLNMSHYMTVVEMIPEVANQRESGDYYTFSSLATAAGFRTLDNGIIPWFSSTDLRGMESYMPLIGFALQLEFSEDELNIRCLYDARSWDIASVDELLSLYLASLKVVMAELEEGAESVW